MRYLRGRLTFSNVVALIALFVSLGGGVYAASKINGKEIKKTSIAGKKLKPDTLTGKQIKESSLGTVPSADSAGTATSADSAKSAQDAQTLAGSGPGAFVSSGDIKRIRFDVTTDSTTPTRGAVLQLGPLTDESFVPQERVSPHGFDLGRREPDGTSDTPSTTRAATTIPRSLAAVDLVPRRLTCCRTLA